jgi:hypothetical protein
MDDDNERMARFTAEVADLKLKTGRAGVERGLQLLGVVLMVAGVVVALGAYSASLGVTVTPGSNIDVLDSNSYQILSVAGLAVSLVGGFVFLRYSLAQFLRFWLLRQSYEQQVALAEARRGADPAPVDA